MRPSTSSGLRPVYCQATETTGILMLGKMSVGVRRMSTGAAIRMRIAEDNEGIGPVKREPYNPHEALSRGERFSLYDCNGARKDAGNGR